jgi:NADPH:quinone reductase
MLVGQKVWSPCKDAFAEYVVAPWWKVAPLPSGVDDRDGVSMASIAVTALTLCKEAYTLKKGDWCLIRAAAGGVGAILVQVNEIVVW